jgi:hypothetical protein
METVISSIKKLTIDIKKLTNFELIIEFSGTVS